MQTRFNLAKVQRVVLLFHSIKSEGKADLHNFRKAIGVK